MKTSKWVKFIDGRKKPLYGSYDDTDGNNRRFINPNGWPLLVYDSSGRFTPEQQNIVITTRDVVLQEYRNISGEFSDQTKEFGEKSENLNAAVAWRKRLFMCALTDHIEDDGSLFDISARDFSFESGLFVVQGVYRDSQNAQRSFVRNYQSVASSGMTEEKLENLLSKMVSTHQGFGAIKKTHRGLPLRDYKAFEINQGMSDVVTNDPNLYVCNFTFGKKSEFMEE